MKFRTYSTKLNYKQQVIFNKLVRESGLTKSEYIKERILNNEPNKERKLIMKIKKLLRECA